MYELIKDYCNREKISIYEFEKLCSLGNGSVGKWRDRKAKPSVSSLLKIEQATGIPAAIWLRGGNL